jgi:hypothetical protein
LTPAGSGIGGKHPQEVFRRRPTAGLIQDFLADMRGFLPASIFAGFSGQGFFNRLVRAFCVERWRRATTTHN